MAVFKSCKDCTTRHRGCHDSCKAYQKEKRLQEELKLRERRERTDGERVERERSEWIHRNMPR